MNNSTPHKNTQMMNSPITHYVLLAFGLFSAVMALFGEFDTMLAWWLAIALLLLPLLWAFKTPYVALKTICGISFITQSVTLPFFYLYRNDFAFQRVKPFCFTASEAFPMLAKVSLFLFSMLLFFKLIYPLSLFGGSPRKTTYTNLQVVGDKNLIPKYSVFDVSHNRKPRQFSLLIILLIALLTPINLWSFSQGIGLTGVAPPALPYRLSGILFYLTKYITPALINYFYFKTKRGWPLMSLVLAYACLLGLSSVSRGAVLFVMFPVLTLAWLDKRKIMFGVAFIGTIIGIEVATAARSYVYIVTANKSEADTSISIYKVIFNVFTDPGSAFLDLDFLPKLVSGILGRIESFDNLVMAQYYDPNAVIGAWGFILRLIGLRGSDFDINAHMIQWQGNVLPEGFYNGGALLSNAVIVGNAHLGWTVLSAMVTAVFLVLLEKSSDRIARKYALFELLNTPIVFVLTVIFFTSTGAGPVFTFLFVLLFFASWLPPIGRKNQLRQLKLKPSITHQLRIRKD